MYWKRFLPFFGLEQGINGSAHKPTLVQDTDHIVETTYHLSLYLDPFRAYLLPQ